MSTRMVLSWILTLCLLVAPLSVTAESSNYAPAPKDTAAALQLDVEFDQEMEGSIVGTSEANSLLNKFDNESPLGQALIGAEVGETVTVDAPAGSFQYKVLSISKNPN